MNVNKMDNKAQASTEYLVILAVVIIVALVAVAVLGGFIDIGRGTGEQACKTYWRGAEIGLMDWRIRSGATDDELVFRNNMDYTIQITTVSVGGNVEDVADFTLSPGETNTVVDDFVDVVCLGNSVSYEVIITYDNLEHSITGKTFTGTKNIEGTCVA